MILCTCHQWGGREELFSLDKENIVVEDQWIGEFSLTLWRRLMGDEKPLMVTYVYELVLYSRTEASWKELHNIQARLDIPWCVGGDFNKIKFVGERKGEMLVDRFMKAFPDFMDKCGLIICQCQGVISLGQKGR